MRSLIQKIKNAHFSLQLSILTNFISFFAAGMLALMLIGYYRMSNNALYTSTNILDKSSTVVHNEITTQMKSAETLAGVISGLLNQNIIDIDTQLPRYLDYTQWLLKNHTSAVIQEIVWGDEQSNTYIQEKNRDGTLLTEMSHFPGAITSIYRNQQGDIIKKIVAPNKDYDPRRRPWYIDLKKSGKQFMWTNLFGYKFASAGLLGVAALNPVYYLDGRFRGIVFIGIRMDFFGKYISKIFVSQNATINIMTKDGQLFATSVKKIQDQLSRNTIDVNKVDIPGLAASFKDYSLHGQAQFMFKYNGQKYLANYRPLHQKQWLIAIIAPSNDFIGPIVRANLITMAVGFLIFLLGIAAISRIVKRMVKPLRLIAKETEKIKEFNLEGNKPIFSRIKEISSISYAINNMKHGLRSFQKYVSAPLVRQLIEQNEDAVVGGKKQELSIVFSDIQNFTTLSENMLPDQLMQHLCEYLNKLTHIIIDHRGTIDKYIGDSIMAFWGAPLPEKYPCHQAAKAVLKCRETLKELNAKWLAEGKPVLVTRFGIHYGAAVVGNLGSDDHLSYTAIGDSINTANRLEQINKTYHTEILVSESVYEAIKDQFILRVVDRVVFKGKSNSILIYELLGEKE